MNTDAEAPNDPGEDSTGPCRRSACAILTNNILHLSAAWMLLLRALSYSADNPLPHIWNWLLGSQWHNPINKSCCLLLTVVQDPKEKTWRPWLNSGDYPHCWGVEKWRIQPVYVGNNRFLFSWFASVYTQRTKKLPVTMILVFLIHSFYPSKSKWPYYEPLANASN